MQVVLKHRFAFCVLTAFAALATSATDYYVATTGSDDNDGLAAETAFATIDKAVSVATAADAIYVAPGTYTTTTKNSPEVKCALVGQGASRDDVVIQAGATYRALKTAATACITNVTIVGNTANKTANGGAVYMVGGTIVDCVIRDGTSTGDGGNVYMKDAAATIRKCVISGGASSGGEGGNVYLQVNGSVVEDCLIKDGTIGNVKEKYGANVFVKDATRLSRCRLTGGSHGYSADPNAASLIVSYASSAQVEDCLVTGSTCGGVVLRGGGSRLYNVAVVNNVGAGVWSWNVSQFFYNTVVYGNRKADGTNRDWAGNKPNEDGAFVNCAVGTDSGFAAGAYPGLVLLDDASCFADYANGDYRPSADGALTNAGAMDPRRQAASTTDVAGNPRTVNAIDIGCYEYQPTTFYATFDATLGGREHAGESVAFAATSANADDADVSYSWDFGDGSDPVVTAEASVSHVYAAGGLYTVTLTATSGNATFQQARTDYVPVYGIVWVNANATPQIPYATEATGLKTIPEALAIHASKTGEVRIASGTYEVSAQQTLTSAIVVRGMGATPDDVIVTNTATATAGSPYKRVFEVANADARVENLTMTGGQVYNQYGGNLRVAAGVVSNCVIRGGLVTANGGNAGGAGVEIAGQGVVTHCWITNNVMSGTGAETAWGSGAVLWTYNSKGKLYNSLVAYNTYIPSKVARGAAGIQLGGGNDAAVVENCTIVSNVVQGAITTAAGVWSDSSWYTTFRNCVIAGNWQTASNAFSSATMTSYSKVYNCVADDAVKTTKFNDGSGFTITATDSLFADFAGGDFTPKMGSALRNKGAAPSVVAATDLAGKTRVFGRAIDVGCYELQQIPGLMLIVR